MAHLELRRRKNAEQRDDEAHRQIRHHVVVRLVAAGRCEAAVDIQRDAHLNILLTSALPNYGGVLTGKFFEYLAACNPILVLINGAQDIEFEQIVTYLDAGIVAYNDRSEKELRTFILNLFNEFQATGKVEPTIRRDRLAELSWKATIGKLATFLNLKKIANLNDVEVK